MTHPPHVCFLNRVYPPTGGATGALLAEMAEALQGRGYDVSVVTGPTDNGTTAPGSDVRVERVGSTPFTNGSHWQRMQTYVARHAGLIRGALQIPSPDVIVTKTDPPMLKVLGPLLARLTGAQRVHWAQDLYPEVAEAAGVLSEEGATAGGLRRASTLVLEQHDHIVAVGRCMRERIIERGVAPEQVSVVPNWMPSAVDAIPHAENAFREEHDLQDRFVVMYSGNLGLAHSFTPILDAATQLQRTDPAVCILFVGDGPRKSVLQKQVAGRNIDNVRFLPFQPWDRLAESLSAADLHLVTMNADMEGLVVPSKIYGALRAGRPALFLGPEGSRIALGDGLTLRSWPRSNPLAPTAPAVLSTRRADAVLDIGDDCGFTGTTLVAADRITIGDRVLVGGNASIVDFDFHPLTPEGRAENINAGAAVPIVIEDDVFVGMDALVMKGVTIGEGAVVGAGSVVTQDVPRRAVVAGNPAQVVREL